MERCIIRDKNGNPIQSSRNLRGIRAYVSNHAIDTLAIDRLPSGEGKLMILFRDHSSYETNFADFTVLRDFVRRWRNVYGAPLMVNTQECGKVSYSNNYLY